MKNVLKYSLRIRTVKQREVACYEGVKMKQMPVEACR